MEIEDRQTVISHSTSESDEEVVHNDIEKPRKQKRAYTLTPARQAALERMQTARREKLEAKRNATAKSKTADAEQSVVEEQTPALPSPPQDPEPFAEQKQEEATATAVVQEKKKRQYKKREKPQTPTPAPRDDRRPEPRYIVV